MDIERFDAVTSTFAETEQPPRRDPRPRRGRSRGGRLPSSVATKSWPRRSGRRRRAAPGTAAAPEAAVEAAPAAAAATAAEDRSASATPIPPPVAPPRKARSAAVSGRSRATTSASTPAPTTSAHTAVECTSTDGPGSDVVPQPGRLPLLSARRPSGAATSSVVADSGRQPAGSAFRSATTPPRTSPQFRIIRLQPRSWRLARISVILCAGSDEASPRKEIRSGIDNGARRVYVHVRQTRTGAIPDAGGKQTPTRLARKRGTCRRFACAHFRSLAARGDSLPPQISRRNRCGAPFLRESDRQ